MGSGEGDALKISDLTVTTTPIFKNYFPTTTTGTTSYNSFTYSTHIYLYQITCPKAKCKTNNWLEINKVTPCTSCGSKLRAVDAADVADYETIITK